jgi:hypothetical protein
MSDQDAVQREREMREHERQAAERDPDERDPNQGDASGDPAEQGDNPAPPADVPGTTGQP